VRRRTGLVMTPERRVAYAVLANWQRGSDVRDRVLSAMRTAGDELRRNLL